MKTTKTVLILLLLFSSIVMLSCSTGRGGVGGSSKKCGCGINKGMTGY